MTGRNPTSLKQRLEANPGMIGYQLDVSQAAEVLRLAATFSQDHPTLNAVVNNAGVMVLEDLLADAPGWGVFEGTIATNLLGPIRLTTALLPPLVATNFAPGQAGNTSAMPLDAFIVEAVERLCAERTPSEVLVERALPQRTAERNGRFDAIFQSINPS